MTVAPAPLAIETLDRVTSVARELAAHNIEAIVVDTAAEARERALALVPKGAEVHWAKSKTLDDLGLPDVFMNGSYDAVRQRSMKLDRATQGQEIQKITSAPEYMLGSVQAVTEAGELVVVSYSASQLGPYASGAGHLILIVGSQKIVPTLDDGVRRAREIVQPYESERLREQFGVDSRVAKLLVIFEEAWPGRTTVILVREPVGV